MPENGLTEPVIGVTLDGSGYGPDGAVWGGEFLTGDYHSSRRAGRLRYVRLPGGDRAIREPWRGALAHLLDAGRGEMPTRLRVPAADRRAVRAMVERGLNAPLTSSAGRLFDAVAALAGVRGRVGYEGQAAAELEGLAADAPPDGGYPFEVAPGPVFEADTWPLIRAVAADAAAGTPAPVIARRFHTTFIELIASVCGRIRHDTGLGAVVLSGGVFLDAVLTSEACARLRADGFRVYRHRLVPPGDGGLSRRLPAVAAHHLHHRPGDPTPETTGCVSASPAG